MKVVLDADLVIGALDGSDAHHARARALFEDWGEQEVPRVISVVNLTEILVAPAAQSGQLRAAREAVAALGVTIHRPSEAIGVEAARLRNRHPISVPDAYCLATAKHVSGSVASFDEKVVRAAVAEELAQAVLAQ